MKKKLWATLLLLISVLCLAFGLTACDNGGGNGGGNGSDHVHNFTEYMYNDDATCTEDGTETGICSCGETDTRTKSGTALGHEFGEYSPNGDATCTEDGTETAMCIRCDETDTRTITGSKLGHTFEIYVPNGDATCTENGTETATCIRCDETDTREDEDSALGHEYIVYVDNDDATCTEDGTETATCVRCGERNEETTRVKYGSALGHDTELHAGTATCTEAGTLDYWKCSRCNKDFIDEEGTAEIEEYETEVPLGHEFTAENKCVRYDTCKTVWEYTDGLTYSLNWENNYSVTGIGTASGDIVIPYGYQGKPVTSIGEHAFYGCNGLTSITIPESVTSIGDWAFAYCRKLTSITIPDSVTLIGMYVFEGCSGLTAVHIKSLEAWCNLEFYDYTSNPLYYAGHLYLDGEKITVLTIHDAITKIKAYAFYGCSGLTSIEIPDSVTSIGDYAFSGCSGLTSVTIGSGVTSIGDGAFYNCIGLKDVTIPDSVAEIGGEAFYKCTGLTSITIPDSVTELDGKSMFYGCSSLTDVTLPQGMTKIEGSMFLDCVSLKNITIPSSVTEIGVDAFHGCVGLTDITIPSSVTSVRENVFLECDGLEIVTFGKRESSIFFYQDAFRGCTSLKKVVVPDLRSWLGCLFTEEYPTASPLFFAHHLYIGTTELTELEIPETFSVVGANAFAGGAFTSLKFNGKETSIGASAFRNCDKLTGTITIPSTVKTIGMNAFEGCTNLSGVTFGSGVTQIGEKAFFLCTGLKEITIPAQVTKIGWGAFAGCSGLEALSVAQDNKTYRSETNCLITRSTNALLAGCNASTIPADVKKIDPYAFYDCDGLEGQLTLPEGVDNIGYYAFYDCNGLTGVIIPDGVGQIGEHAFDGCNGLMSITIPDSVTKVEDGAFDGCTNIREATMPALATASIPKNRLQKVVLTSGYKIESPSFQFCYELMSITIPESMVTIEDDAFFECCNLIEVWNYSNLPISKGMSTHGGIAYYAQYVYKTDAESKQTTDADGFVFYEDDGKSYLIGYTGNETILTLPDKAPGGADYEIYRYAFEGCLWLTGVKFGKAVTAIGSSAFYGCYKLIEVWDLTGRSDSYLNFLQLASNHAKNIYTTDEPTKQTTDSNGFLFYQDGEINYLLGYTGNKTDLTLPEKSPSGKNYEIYQYAFKDRDRLTSVTIPDSVTSIEKEAFYGCSELTDIQFNGSVKDWQAIEKAENWDSYTGDYTITCTDGTIDKNGNVTYFE